MENDYLSLALFSTFFLHLPFGFMGARFQRFSRAWGRCLYIPILLTIAVRRIAGIGYASIPLFIVVALGGQIMGRRTARPYS